MFPLPFPVVAIADLSVLGPRLVPSVSAAVEGGLPWILLRAKEARPEERRDLARGLLGSCPGLLLSVHGDPEGARVTGAFGLHLPSRGFDVAQIRRGQPERLLGVSCHGAAEIRAAEEGGADYVFLSPLFAPTSKSAGGEVLGADGFRAASDGARIPVLALGGITPERISAAAEAGAAGVAVLGDLFLARDVAGRARELREAAERAFRGEACGSLRRKG